MIMRFVLAAAVAAALSTVANAQQVQKKEFPGVRNYSRVDATVGCGGQIDTSAVAALKGEGFVSIINLRLASEEGANVEGERAAAQAAGVKYIHLPFNAAQPDPKVVDSFLVAVADKSNQPVFIHCGSASRVGGVWAIKRALADKWPVEKALTEGKAIGLNNPGLETFVVNYIKSHQ
jgi:uncharacterized protein (TIGR01244 family)